MSEMYLWNIIQVHSYKHNKSQDKTNLSIYKSTYVSTIKYISLVSSLL